METRKFTVVKEGFILGSHYNEGDTIHLTEKQARTFEREGRIRAGAVAKPKAAPGKEVLADTGK